MLRRGDLLPAALAAAAAAACFSCSMLARARLWRLAFSIRTHFSRSRRMDCESTQTHHDRVVEVRNCVTLTGMGFAKHYILRESLRQAGLLE